MGYREIKSTPIFNEPQDAQPSFIPKVTIPKSAFTFPLKPRPTPTKPLPTPAPEPEIVPHPDPLPPEREPIYIQEVPMDYPMPTPALNPQPQQVPPRQFIPFVPPQPTPTAQRTITIPSVTLPTLNTTNAKKYGIALVKMAIAIVFIWFGLTSTGSFFGPASSKFAGQLAQVFYVFQVGTLLAMIGVVLAYDAISRLR
jgi:hypothetical protein